MRSMVFSVLFSALLWGESFVLVTHPDSPIDVLNEAEARMIYLKQRRYWDGLKLEPINLPPMSALRRSFEKKLLKMDRREIEDHWLKQHYKGLRPPYRVESVQSALMYIQSVKGAIAYIPENMSNKELKILYREPVQ